MTESNSIRLCPAELKDRDQLFAWRNDPWLISFGSSGCPVEKEEHSKWFDHALSGDDCLLFIIVTEQDIPAGSLRFDRKNDGIVLTSVFLSKEHTGKGYGVLALRSGCEMAFEAWRMDEITALIKEQNSASLSAFAKADFVAAPSDEATPPGHRRFILTRSAARTVSQSPGTECGTL